MKFNEVDKKRYQLEFSTEEMARSGTFRELRGIEVGLLTLGAGLRGERVQWGLDHWAECRSVEFGSTKREEGLYGDLPQNCVLDKGFRY